MKPKIAIIGGGWAGLAAAEALCEQAQVEVFEAGRQAGGRARALAAEVERGFSGVDNGQHIMLGAYSQVLALLKRSGVALDEAFCRLPMQWYLHDGWQFRARHLPAPLHLLAGILLGKGFATGEKLELMKQMCRLKQMEHAADWTVGTWLRAQGASRRLWLMFWQPLVWGSLNTDLEYASLARLRHVLQDGAWASRLASDFLLPKKDLGALMVEPVCTRIRQFGGSIHLGVRQTAPIRTTQRRWQVGDALFDGVIVAVAPYHAASLLPNHAPLALHEAFAKLNYHAITTVYLRYPHSIRLPSIMTGLVEGTAQWLIDRQALGFGQGEVSAVISVSDQYPSRSREEWMRAVHWDMRRICPDVSAPADWLVVTEKRATVASSKVIPHFFQEALRHDGFQLAGDYLHDRYPATLEAAVQSGRLAAGRLLSELVTS